MNNISQLRTIVNNGWTIANRKNVTSQIGERNFAKLVGLAKKNGLADVFEYQAVSKELTPAKFELSLKRLKKIITDKKIQDLTKDLESKISPKNFIGQGAEADVYAINKDYVLRIVGKQKYTSDMKFRPVEDVFDGRSFGQSIFKANDFISISKRLKGVPMHNVNEKDVNVYLENLRKYADLPTKTLDDFANDVAFINKRGYRIDQSNPENFLLDKKGKINILDLAKKDCTSLDLYEPYGHDWLLDPLVNGHDLCGVYEKMNEAQRRETIELITKLENRIIPICKKYDIPISKWKKDDYMFCSLMSILEVRDKLDYRKILFEETVRPLYPERIEKLDYYIEKYIKGKYLYQ